MNCFQQNQQRKVSQDACRISVKPSRGLMLMCCTRTTLPCYCQQPLITRVTLTYKDLGQLVTIVTTIIMYYCQYYHYVLLSSLSLCIIVNIIIMYYCRYYHVLLLILSLCIIVNTIIMYYCQYYHYVLLSILSLHIIVVTIITYYCRYYHYVLLSWSCTFDMLWRCFAQPTLPNWVIFYLPSRFRI